MLQCHVYSIVKDENLKNVTAFKHGSTFCIEMKSGDREGNNRSPVVIEPEMYYEKNDNWQKVRESSIPDVDYAIESDLFCLLRTCINNLNNFHVFM